MSSFSNPSDAMKAVDSKIKSIKHVADTWMVDTPEEDGAKFWSYRALAPNPKFLFGQEDLDSMKILYVEDADAVKAGVTDREQKAPFDTLAAVAQTF